MSICFPLTKTQSSVTITTSKYLTISRSTKSNPSYSTSDTDISGMAAYTASHRTFIEKAHRRITLSDIYHIWANKKEGITDIDFAAGMRKFLQHLQDERKMNSFRITRCKLGFRSIQDLPEWHIMMEFENMAQLDQAFTRVIPREGELEREHTSFNKYVEDDIQHALYRDWPDFVNKPKLTGKQKPYTIDDIVKATKNIDPDLWKKK